MVRKWSYLNQNYLKAYKAFNSFKKVKTFKVFRKTTKFKKFTKGLTRVVKIKYVKRMFSLNYLVLKQITKSWSLNYIQWKQLSRFSQSFLHSPILSHGPNYEIFNEITKPTDQILNLHLFSCSTSLITRFMWSPVGSTKNNSSKALFTQQRLRNSKLSFIQTNSLNSSHSNECAHPLSLTFHNLSYHPYESSDSLNQIILYKSLISTTFHCNLQLVLNIYKVIVLNTLRITKTT
jgi:hypothetical protein